MEVKPFTDKQIALLETFADQAVIAIETVRPFTELGTRNRELTETLEQQTATAEILRVISSSPTDLRAVFGTIVRNATRMCEGSFGAVYQYDGERIHFIAYENFTGRGLHMLERGFPATPSRDSMIGLEILDGSIQTGLRRTGAGDRSPSLGLGDPLDGSPGSAYGPLRPVPSASLDGPRSEGRSAGLRIRRKDGASP